MLYIAAAGGGLRKRWSYNQGPPIILLPLYMYPLHIPKQVIDRDRQWQTASDSRYIDVVRFKGKGKTFCGVGGLKNKDWHWVNVVLCDQWSVCVPTAGLLAQSCQSVGQSVGSLRNQPVFIGCEDQLISNKTSPVSQLINWSLMALNHKWIS